MKFFAFILLAMVTGLASAVEPASSEIPDTLEERAKPCIICHRDADLIDRDAYFPRIAGKPAGYLYNQLRNFRDGRRFYQPMAILLENMSDEYMQEIAAYFASLPYAYLEPAVPAMAKRCWAYSPLFPVCWDCRMPIWLHSSAAGAMAGSCAARYPTACRK